MVSNLKTARNLKGLKQKDLAGLLNVSPKTISDYELGEREPDLKTLAELSRILDVTTDYLLGIEKVTMFDQLRSRIGRLQKDDLEKLLNEYLDLLLHLK